MAQVIRREKRTFNDEVCSYLVLEVPARGWATSGGMTLSVPEASAVEIGVRHAISDEEAGDVVELLATRNVHVPTNWSRRFKNHQEKLKSGDVYECAEVVRNLALRSATARLSAGEQAMYVRARTILTSELAVSWDTDEDGANARIDDALGLVTHTS